MTTYKKICRDYVDGDETGTAWFIAQGQWADGHLAYSRFDEDGYIMEEEQCMYAQVRENGKLLMVRI